MISKKEDMSLAIIQHAPLVVNKVKEINITSAETLQEAVVFVQKIKEISNKIEKLRKSRLAPLNKEIREINEKYKPYIEALKNAEKELKEKIAEYKIKQQTLSQEVLSSDIVVNGRAMGTPDVVFRSHWTYKVVDESKVPRDYLMLDHSKIMNAINNGERNIPGLEIYDEGNVAIRRKDSVKKIPSQYWEGI